MTEEETTRELRSRVRDVRVFALNRDFPDRRIGIISPFTGVLDRRATAAGWSRQQLTFLTLRPLLAAVFESRSTVRDTTVEHMAVETEDTGSDAGQDEDRAVSVRELIRQRERSATSEPSSTRRRSDSPQRTLDSRDDATRAPSASVKPGTRMPVADPTSAERTDIAPDSSPFEMRRSTPPVANEDRSSQDAPAEMQSAPAAGVSAVVDRTESITDSSDVSDSLHPTAQQRETEDTDVLAMSVRKRHRSISKMSSEISEMTSKHQRGLDRRGIRDPRVIRDPVTTDAPRAETTIQAPGDQSVSMVEAQLTPSTDTTVAEQQAVPTPLAVPSRDTDSEAAPTTESAITDTGDRPRMEALRTPLVPPARSSAPTPSGQQQPEHLPMETDHSPSRSDRTTSTTTAETDGDQTPMNTQEEATDLVDRIDVDRLASRLERVFERNERIERERRGR